MQKKSQKERKREIVKKLKELIDKYSFFLFLFFEKIPVERQRELKKKFKKETQGKLFVVKRRLLFRALKEKGIDFPEFKGPVMVGVGNDEVLCAKIIKNFPTKEGEKLEFIGGFLKEKEKYEIFDKKALQEIADLPSREELFAKFVGALSYPLTGLSFALGANLQKFVNVLKEIEKTKK